MQIGDGTRALVTGASKGIGRALAEALAARGATVGLAARGEDELTALAGALGSRAVTLPCDVGDAESVSGAIERFAAGTGGLELAIANAGIAHYGRFEDQDPELHERAFAEALRHELAGSGVSVTTVLPGEIVSSLHDHEKATMPAWYRGDSQAAPASSLASAVLAGIEADRRRVAYPREVSLLALNAVAPGLVDRLLRRLRGPSAAPRR
jgi:short-subunit dehydrogenase